MKRRVALGACLLIGLLAAPLTFSVWMAAPRHTITREAFDAIVGGMDESQVHDLFGVPPGDYTSRPVLVADLHGNLYRLLDGERRKWMSDNGVFWVWFDAEGRVTAARAPAVLLVPAEPWFAKVRRWLGL